MTSGSQFREINLEKNRFWLLRWTSFGLLLAMNVASVVFGLLGA
jgi:hypothetical protein